MEAVRTNILGTDNVLNAAHQNRVEKVICLSTDKAVYPINAMGVSKAMMEKIMASKARISYNSNTIYTSTRYGNVMASRGSVIPLFVKQIKDGKAITITDPNMTRFLMSLSEAVDLVLYAFNNAKQGDIFVQKAPAATIIDLATALNEIFNSKNKIRIIGTRHGEKLYETLLTREEMAKSEDLGNYYRILPDDRDLNYGKYFTEGEQHISSFQDYHSHNTIRLDVEQIKQKLMNIDFIQRELLNH
jgi:UDP-N-acetylglucosamine 4,6-dehydratase